LERFAALEKYLGDRMSALEHLIGSIVNVGVTKASGQYDIYKIEVAGGFEQLEAFLHELENTRDLIDAPRYDQRSAGRYTVHATANHALLPSRISELALSVGLTTLRITARADHAKGKNGDA
jgi:hypothetical protein